MLVLSRKQYQGIEISHPDLPGGKIKVRVVEIRGNKVRLGIEADREIVVHRDEVAEIIRREKGETEEEDREKGK